MLVQWYILEYLQLLNIKNISSSYECVPDIC